MAVLHDILGFIIKKVVKPAQTAYMHPSLLGLVALLTGRYHLVNISLVLCILLRSKKYLHVNYIFITVLITYVMTRKKKWNQTNVVLDNIFAYNVALDIISENKDPEPKSIEECQ